MSLVYIKTSNDYPRCPTFVIPKTDEHKKFRILDIELENNLSTFNHQTNELAIIRPLDKNNINDQWYLDKFYITPKSVVDIKQLNKEIKMLYKTAICPYANPNKIFNRNLITVFGGDLKIGNRIYVKSEDEFYTGIIVKITDTQLYLESVFGNSVFEKSSTNVSTVDESNPDIEYTGLYRVNNYNNVVIYQDVSFVNQYNENGLFYDATRNLQARIFSDYMFEMEIEIPEIILFNVNSIGDKNETNTLRIYNRDYLGYYTNSLTTIKTQSLKLTGATLKEGKLEIVNSVLFCYDNKLILELEDGLLNVEFTFNDLNDVTVKLYLKEGYKFNSMNDPKINYSISREMALELLETTTEPIPINLQLGNDVLISKDPSTNVLTEITPVNDFVEIVVRGCPIYIPFSIIKEHLETGDPIMFNDYILNVTADEFGTVYISDVMVLKDHLYNLDNHINISIDLKESARGTLKKTNIDQYIIDILETDQDIFEEITDETGLKKLIFNNSCIPVSFTEDHKINAHLVDYTAIKPKSTYDSYLSYPREYTTHDDYPHFSQKKDNLWSKIGITPILIDRKYTNYKFISDFFTEQEITIKNIVVNKNTSSLIKFDANYGLTYVENEGASSTNWLGEGIRNIIEIKDYGFEIPLNLIIHREGIEIETFVAVTTDGESASFDKIRGNYIRFKYNSSNFDLNKICVFVYHKKDDQNRIYYSKLYNQDKEIFTDAFTLISGLWSNIIDGFDNDGDNIPDVYEEKIFDVTKYIESLNKVISTFVYDETYSYYPIERDFFTKQNELSMLVTEHEHPESIINAVDYFKPRWKINPEDKTFKLVCNDLLDLTIVDQYKITIDSREHYPFNTKTIGTLIGEYI